MRGRPPTFSFALSGDWDNNPGSYTQELVQGRQYPMLRPYAAVVPMLVDGVFLLDGRFPATPAEHLLENIPEPALAPPLR